MPLAIYKSGQGYWTRMLTAIGAGVLIGTGVLWIWTELSVIRDDRLRLSIQTGVAVLMVVVLGGLLWWVCNKPRIADFMIATESEMRKVNWPSQREIIGSTWVVISGTAMLAVLLFVVNLTFAKLFMSIGVLEGGG